MIRRMYDLALRFVGRIRVRIRISVGIAVVIGMAVLMIGTISVERQESQVRRQTDVLAKNITHNLADVIKDNLLLNSQPIIQEIIVRFARRDIPGLELIAVIDRKGRYIAHSIIDSIYQDVPMHHIDLLFDPASRQRYETPTYLIYFEPLSITAKKRNVEEKIFLGAVWIEFSKTAVFEDVEETRGTISLISASVSIVAVPLVFFFAGKFLQFGILLADAARLVNARRASTLGLGNGRNMTTRGSIGVLTQELDVMVRQIHEKLEIEKFVSRATVQMVAKGKSSLADGTRKLVTVLFSDIRNFTSVSETLWPEEIVEMLNQYLDVQTRAIHRNHGFVDKFIGDGVMSVFPGDRMAQNAVQAAIEMQRGVAKLNETRKMKNEVVLSIGIGIALGHVVLGSIGSGERMDYTAIGDTVNLASRLCGVAAADEILISENVVTHLDGSGVPVTPKVEVSIKGKRKPVSVFQIGYSLS